MNDNQNNSNENSENSNSGEPIKYLQRSLYYHSILPSEEARLGVDLNLNEIEEFIPLEDAGSKYYFCSCKPVRDGELWVIKYYKVITDSLTDISDEETEDLIEGTVGVPIIAVIDVNKRVGNSLATIAISPFRNSGRSKTLLQQIFNIIEQRSDISQLEFPAVAKHIDKDSIEDTHVASFEYAFTQPDRRDLSDLQIPGDATVLDDYASKIAEYYGGATIKIYVSRGKKKDHWLERTGDAIQSIYTSKVQIRDEESHSLDLINLLNMQEKSTLKIPYQNSIGRPNLSSISRICIDDYMNKKDTLIANVDESNQE